MSRHPRRTSEVIIARSKRTGQKYATRTSYLAGHNGNRGPFLHYTDSTRLETCRCDTANSHQKPYPVSDDDTNLAIAITRYMDKFDLKSCHQPDFHRYRERQKIDWALRSVHAERFHYVSRDKTVVCRCNSLDHLSCRRVHNPEIQELCANFFLLESAVIKCTREQWRESEGGATTPIKSTPSRKDSLEPERDQHSSDRSLFEYDNPSVIRLLQIRGARSLESRKHRSYRDDSYVSPPREHMANLSNGPNGEPDVPEFVWRVSRPSVYLGQNQYEESLMSTPIGTAATPVEQKDLNIDPMSLKGRPSPLAVGATAPWVDQYFNTDSNILGSQCVYESSERLDYRTESVRVGDRCDSAVDFAGPQVSLAETSQPSTPGSPETTTHLVELPSIEHAIELESSLIMSSSSSHYSRSLSEGKLVGGKHAVELNGRTSTPPSRTSKGNILSHRLTRLTQQPLGDSRLPSQEDFFLQWVEVCSRARPAPLDDCSLCNNCLDAPNKSTIRLPCGHYMHHECLVSQFRVQDLEYGNCPACGMALCERTLHDRIDTDRGAIFGQSFTNLQVEERIEFARRSEIVSCWSEEEVAAAQLRLLKDYIDVHADDLYIQWQETGLEPDWHNAVVIPVVQLFKGWSVPNRTRNCSCFADRDAFYKLVVWAELVRLMNTVRGAVRTLQGVNAPFPQLRELYRKFMLAKERYEREKKTWPTNRSGVLMCEKVAQDAFSLAVGTHLGSRP